jgi:predicted patatin/cPLA2 family phospholipase
MSKKRALIVEGGGMRGAHSAGALAELSRHSLHFDVVCASSAGSCTAAFWVAGQHWYEKVWGRHLHGRQFIRFGRLFAGKPVIDLDYLIYEVFGRREPLDTEKILSSPEDFFITATDCGTGEPIYFHNKQKIDVLGALKAGAALPLAYPLPVWYEGIPCGDGGIADAIPLQKAIEEGCEEFWILLTRPRGYRKKPISKFPWPRWVYRKYPALAALMLRRHLHFNETLDKIEALERQGKAFVIRPSAKLPLTRLTRRQDRILAAIEQGKRDAAALFHSNRTSSTQTTVS